MMKFEEIVKIVRSIERMARAAQVHHCDHCKLTFHPAVFSMHMKTHRTAR